MVDCTLIVVYLGIQDFEKLVIEFCNDYELFNSVQKALIIIICSIKINKYNLKKEIR